MAGLASEEMPEGPNKAVPDRVELAYPLRYTFKIMGLAADDFAEHARLLVAGVVGSAPADRVTVRQSSAGKYHSVSVNVVLFNEEQRRAVYQALWDDERVVYYL
jgi:uncharacterized protein